MSAVALLFTAALGFLWFTGIADFLMAQRYEDFSWPTHANFPSTVNESIRTQRPASDPINIWNRSLIMIPDCGRGSYAAAKQSNRILVIIKSAVHNFEARNVIRRTWAAVDDNDKWRLKYIFVLGSSSVRSISRRVEFENLEHRDILLSHDFLDSYYANGKKFGLSLWLSVSSSLSTQCPSAFTLLIDDDYMLNTQNFKRLLSSRQWHQPLYEGWKMVSGPYRWRHHKHRVSVFEYPFDEYPPYITGGAVLLSVHTAQHFYYGSLYTELYSFDDVYAGILAKILMIEPTHNDLFPYWSNATQSIDWNLTIAAHGFSPAEMVDVFPDVLMI